MGLWSLGFIRCLEIEVVLLRSTAPEINGLFFFKKFVVFMFLTFDGTFNFVFFYQ